MKIKNVALLTLILAICPALAQAEDQRRAADESPRARMSDERADVRFQKMIDQSVDIYNTMGKDSRNQLPSSVRKNARCVVILPEVTTAALLIGGTQGSGLASCKTSSGAWSMPAAVSLSGGSIGVQAGVKSADILLFVVNKEAENALKLGTMQLGADVGLVAGSFDESFDTSKAGVVAYSRSEGAYAGASINGTKLGKDEDELNKYYGTKVNYLPLLEGSESPSTTISTTKLTSLFPRG